jgi:F-type H+-transporting ATPase subunit a
LQTAIEVAYDLTKNNITGVQHGRQAGGALVSFPRRALLLIWFSNMIGFLPLPTNTEHPVNILGVEVPRLRPLRGDREHLDPAGPDARRLVSYHVEGSGQGLHPYFASWLPPGLEDMNPIGKARSS